MKNPAKKILLAILCLGVAWSLSAQTTITGVVTDETGEPLIGAGVIVEGTQIGTVTGIDGDYSLTVPAAIVRNVPSSKVRNAIIRTCRYPRSAVTAST